MAAERFLFGERVGVVRLESLVQQTYALPRGRFRFPSSLRSVRTLTPLSYHNTRKAATA